MVGSDGWHLGLGPDALSLTLTPRFLPLQSEGVVAEAAAACRWNRHVVGGMGSLASA